MEREKQRNKRKKKLEGSFGENVTVGVDGDEFFCLSRSASYFEGIQNIFDAGKV